MKRRELINLGIVHRDALDAATEALASAAAAGIRKSELRETVRAVVANPSAYLEDAHFGSLAKTMCKEPPVHYVPQRTSGPAPYRTWGTNLDRESIEQMDNACSLPVSIMGALMPDAHVGYGLPIGGVLATDNAVIPYAVGVDIACRMKMTVLDMPHHALTGQTDRLKNALERETQFGVGATFKNPRRHEVMDEDWSVSPVTQRLKDKAWSQLGTSGSGNHFVEYGTLDVMTDDLKIPRGTYLALLSHSGSRGAGAQVADHFSKLAAKLHPELPKNLIHLAWLSLDSEPGQEYWNAMELMGRYAAANHACIHKFVAKALGVRTLLDIENHHNFAWIEQHQGRRMVVHRKGATPAGEGVLGIIPGSMATPGYVVRGKGHPESLNSASHGAGRRMSRKKAKETLTWSDTKKYLEERGVTVLSAGIDEAPMAYKDIEQVMAAQEDLVEILARFTPKLVKMAPAGERPED